MACYRDSFTFLPRDETSEHAMDLQIITKAQNIRLQNHADHIF
jgi:hypothetical protein